MNINEETITLEEVKELAKKFGYHLIKINNKEKLLPCICGFDKRMHLFDPDGEFIKCRNCGFRGPSGNNPREAARNWNLAVKGEIEVK